MTNPLLETHALPPYRHILPEHAIPAIEALLAEARTVIAEVLRSAETPDWQSLVARLEEAEDRISKAWSPVSHLNAVVNSPAWREAYNACLPLLSAYYTELGQNSALCDAYKRLAAGPAYKALDTAQRKVIDNTLRDFRLSGVDLAADRKQRYAEIAERLSTLSAQFGDNVLDATQGWDLHLTDAGALAGLPDSALTMLRELAEAKGLQGYRVTLDAPAYLAVMTYADDRALRETLYTAYVTRASDQGPQAGHFDNSAIIAEILALRHEQARLLGFASYAELSLVPKMADSVGEVMQFLQDLASRGRPGALADLAELRAYASQHLHFDDFRPWDQAYVSEKLKQAKYAISQEALRSYFPAPRVIDGMLRIAERLFDLEIRPGNAEVWHEDVTFYDISRNGKYIASFYLDPYARANKRGGAWMADCRVRRRLVSGELQCPVATLTCNFTPPVDGKPALLTHTEVTTLLHEFGHGLHHMLTTVEAAGVSGINGVAWDAVELPSQFMENFCWQPETLAMISGNVDDGRPLPTDLLDKMLAARNFQSGLQLLRQLEFAISDMTLHSGEPPSIAGIQTVFDAVRRQVAVLQPPVWNRFQNSFTHIFAGGYAAGYYSYKWAELLSSDAFSRFEEEGILNPATGQAFQQHILSAGGSEDAAVLFERFRGRPPKVDALLRHSGLAA